MNPVTYVRESKQSKGKDMRLPHVKLKMITRVREIETVIWTDSNKIENVQNASRSEEARSVADIWWHETSEFPFKFLSKPKRNPEIAPTALLDENTGCILTIFNIKLIISIRKFTLRIGKFVDT